MKKRVLSLTTVFLLLLSLLAVKTGRECLRPQAAAAQSSKRSLTVDVIRGDLLDCRGRSFTNVTERRAYCVVPTAAAPSFLRAANAERETEEALQNGMPVIVKTDKALTLPTDGCAKAITTFARYTDSTAVHLLGDVNVDGCGVGGLEECFDEELRDAGGELSVVYEADALGRLLATEPVGIHGNGYYTRGGVMLTVDKAVQEITEKALRDKGVSQGAVVVLDVQTGGILALASAPTYERENVAAVLNDASAPLLNRALCAYPVGSVFKVVTAAAALENGETLGKTYCGGSVTLSGNRFFCHNRGGHGFLTFEKAMAYSCNPYFIECGVSVGGTALLAEAKALRFGEALDIGGGLTAESGTLPNLKSLNSDAAVGNLSFGQGELTATPLQIAALYNTIAAGGTYRAPHAVQGLVSRDGDFSPMPVENESRVLSTETCAALTKALAACVEYGTAEDAASDRYTCACKTATAQTGTFDEKGDEKCVTWFVGFFPLETPRYTVCIVKENGISGSVDGAPVFKEIAEAITQYDLTRTP